MQVSSATAATNAATNAASSASSTSSGGTVDYNNFLKLLIAELKNQDPTAPSDPTQYISQLASFSNVEQAVQTNSKLDTMLTMSYLTQAETVIGKTVTSADGKTSGKVISVKLDSNGLPNATLDTGKTLTLDGSVTVSA